MVDLSKMPPLPAAHYGTVQKQPTKDDEPPEAEGMDDDDDELMPVTDPSLVDMLGFDPLEWENEEDEEEDKPAAKE